MNIEKCEKCGSQLLESTNEKHYGEIFGKNVFICDIMGLKCLNCGHIHIDEDTRKRIEDSRLVRRAELMEARDYTHISINKTKEVRNITSLTQKMIGGALGVTEQRYGTIERSSNIPTITTASYLAAILDVDVSEIYESVFIKTSFYDKLRDMELVEEDGKYNFRINHELTDARNELYRLREVILQLGYSKRGLKSLLRSGEITQEEMDKRIKDADKEIKRLKKEKEKAEQKVKDLESDVLVLKQGEVIDYSDWVLLKEEFKEEFEG